MREQSQCLLETICAWCECSFAGSSFLLHFSTSSACIQVAYFPFRRRYCKLNFPPDVVRGRTDLLDRLLLHICFCFEPCAFFFALPILRARLSIASMSIRLPFSENFLCYCSNLSTCSSSSTDDVPPLHGVGLVTMCSSFPPHSLLSTNFFRSPFASLGVAHFGGALYSCLCRSNTPPYFWALQTFQLYYCRSIRDIPSLVAAFLPFLCTAPTMICQSGTSAAPQSTFPRRCFSTFFLPLLLPFVLLIRSFYDAGNCRFFLPCGHYICW